MKHFFLTLAGVFAGLLLFFVGVPFVVIVLVAAAVHPAPAPSHAVLQLDLRQPLSDQDTPSPLAFLNARSSSVMSVVEGLNRARRDANVRGLLIRLPEGGISPAAADALRTAILAFRHAGKPVIAHSQGLYPSGEPVSTYMLGAASGAFWMQPAASLQAVGAASEEMFFKRAFDKYGVQADYQQRYEYKNAVNPFLYDDYTPAHREATLGWMGSIYTSETDAAAHDRGVDPRTLRAALEAGPYLADAALGKRLIDHLGQVADAQAALKAQAGDGATLVDFATYASNAAQRAGSGSAPGVGGGAIGVIEAEGDITTGSSQDKGFNGGGGIRSDDVAQAFQAAVADPQIKAIVFRVSSPGGSDTASEEILAAVRAAIAAGKPVVVSMGTYAASGGYWISSQASEIVAEPTTLTGSIGVFGGKFVIGPALARFGVDTHGVAVGGPYADAFDGGKPFTAAQRAAFAGWMDQIYAGFVDRVAQGRKLSPARVREIAKGRVWTGAQAKDLGLVDRLGGFGLAVAEAKRLGGLDHSATVLKRVTARRSTLNDLGRMFGGARLAAQAGAEATAWLADPRARMLAASLERARLQSSGQGAALANLPNW